MRLRVRTPDGELTFSSRLELSKAYSQGLVDATDEVQEEGSTRWRRAGEIPELVHAEKAARITTSPSAVRMGLFIVAASAALYLVLREDWTQRVIGLLLAFGIAHYGVASLRKTYASRRR